MQKNNLRLPNGKYTNDRHEYDAEWLKRGEIVKNLTGLKVNGFDYGIISFISPDGKQTINLPDWFISLLEGKRAEEPVTIKRSLFGNR